MSLFSELKRRNVFRTAAAYLVVSWLIMQIAASLENALNLPAWFDSMVISVLLIGFPIVMLFSWAYEITPEGIKKEKDVIQDESINAVTAKKLNIITLLAVIAAGGMFAYQQLKATPTITQTVVTADKPIVETSEQIADQAATSEITKELATEQSIAVLPFIDLSPNKDQEYFSDGISEEILNVLVKIQDLKVASRTSSFGFKGQETLGIPQIAEKLKVRHILEGSVRKAGYTVRITAQLIDAETDAHLWSETYDRPLTTENIFAIQDEIAGVIVKELGDLISSDAEKKLVTVSTQSLDAYDLFLKAKSLFHVRSRENIPEVIELLEKVVELDPNFARGWADLAAAYIVAPSWNIGTEEEYYPKVIDAVTKATELDETLSLPYAIMGGIAMAKGDFLSAIEQLDKAIELNPKDIQSVYFRASAIFDLGYLNQAEEGFKNCLKLDPDYGICKRFLSFVLLFKGDVTQGEKLFLEGFHNGQKAYSDVYLEYYGFTNDTKSLSLLLSQMVQNPDLRKLRYKYATDDSYTLKRLMSDIKALSNNDNFHFWTLQRLADNFTAKFLWSPYVPYLHKKFDVDEYLNFRKNYIRNNGVLSYWRKHGFPPQCRPLADDDFECDVLPMVMPNKKENK